MWLIKSEIHQTWSPHFPLVHHPFQMVTIFSTCSPYFPDFAIKGHKKICTWQIISLGESLVIWRLKRLKSFKLIFCDVGRITKAGKYYLDLRDSVITTIMLADFSFKWFKPSFDCFFANTIQHCKFFQGVWFNLDFVLISRWHCGKGITLAW